MHLIAIISLISIISLKTIRFRITSLCRFRTRPTKRPVAEDNDTHSETEGDVVYEDKGSNGKGSPERYNAKGMRVNSNNVISLRHLALAKKIPAKTRDEGTAKFFDATLNLSRGYSLVSLIISGHKVPVEKVRDGPARMIVLRTVAPYCLNDETLDAILKADPEEQNAFLCGLAKNAQQYIKYALYGTVANYMADKVLTKHDIFPSDAIRKHLGLTGDHATKSFMDM